MEIKQNGREDRYLPFGHCHLKNCTQIPPVHYSYRRDFFLPALIPSVQKGEKYQVSSSSKPLQYEQGYKVSTIPYAPQRMQGRSL